MTSAKISDFLTPSPPCPQIHATSLTELPYFVCFSTNPPSPHREPRPMCSASSTSPTLKVRGNKLRYCTWNQILNWSRRNLVLLVHCPSFIYLNSSHSEAKTPKMVSCKPFLAAAVALIFAARINADRVLSLSPFAELVHDYDKGKGVLPTNLKDEQN